MDNIEDYFVELLKELRSIDMAESEFKRHLADDPELQKQYKEWCHETGNTERNGFRDFCEEYCTEMDSVWETLTDFDDQ